MGNINKTFICGSCRSNVKLISEGTFFVCPYCQTKNTIVEKNKLE
jgi:LSD1 subclass zinc finger protein